MGGLLYKLNEYFMLSGLHFLIHLNLALITETNSNTKIYSVIFCADILRVFVFPACALHHCKCLLSIDMKVRQPYGKLAVCKLLRKWIGLI